MEDKSAQDAEFRKLAGEMEDRAEDQREHGVDLGVYSDEWQREEMYQSL